MVLTKLGKYMEKIGMSDEDLAVKALLTSRTIVNIRKGKGCTRNNAVRIAKVLKMKLEDLV